MSLDAYRVAVLCLSVLFCSVLFCPVYLSHAQCVFYALSIETFVLQLAVNGWPVCVGLRPLFCWYRCFSWHRYLASYCNQCACGPEESPGSTT